MSFSASASLTQRSRKALPWLLYLYSFILFGMHFVRIFDNSFWGDEGFTIRLAKMGFVQMCRVTAGDVHPPLYYFFTQILYHILGDHGYVYHLSAVIPYGLILILACTVVRKWFGLIPAAVLATFSSLTSCAIIYNVEVRMYALAALFVLAALLAFYQIYQANRPADWFLFGFASLCAAYTHYYALISVAFFYLMLLPLWRRGREFRQRIIRLYGFTVLGYIVWLYALLKSFKRTAEDWWLSAIATFSDCFDFIWGSRLLSIVALVLFVYYFAVHLWKQFKTKTISGEDMLFLAGLVSIIGTILVGLILSHLIRPFLVPRYLFPLAPVAYLMLGFSVQKLKPKYLAAALLLAALLISGIPTWWKTYRHEQELDNGSQTCTNLFLSSTDPFIYTNDKGWDFTLNASESFPDVPYVSSDDALDSFQFSHQDTWIFWNTALTDVEMQALAEHGCTVKLVYSGLAYHDLWGGKFFTDPYDGIFYLYKVTEALQ